MKVSVVGAAVYDEIITHEGKRRESYGGIIYNLIALSSVGDEDLVILPISNVAEDRFDDVFRIIKDVPKVDTSGLRKVPGELTQVKLIYRTVSQRDEIVYNLMKPLTLEDMKPALDSDGILINFINGTEVDLDTVRKLRGETRAVLHLDIHNKVVRWGEDGRGGKKTYVRFEGWQDWVKNFDVVQMNEFECSMVVGRDLKSQDDYISAAYEILNAGPRVVLVTLGPLGSVMCHRMDGKAYYYHCACPAMDVEKVIDTTGCGDSFSSGFLCNYLKTRNPITANAAANIVGGINCETSGLGNLEKARDAVDKIPEVFPELWERIKEGWKGYQL